MSETTPYTEFTEATTQQGGNKNGAVPPLMSEAGKKLASKTAPQTATKDAKGDKL